MKKKFFAISIALLFGCIGAKAQLLGMLTHDLGGARNLIIGFSPFGYDHINIKKGDEKYKYDYKSYMNFSLGYETQTEGLSYLTELDYAMAKFDKYDLKGTSVWFNPAQSEDISCIAFSQLFGKTFNNFKRVQLPVYFGPRFEYIKGGPFHNLTINACVKARLKIYITGKVGIYVGGTGMMGWGRKKAHEKSSNSSESYNITPTTAYADAGVVIGLN
jgi:hypothetical protein